MNGSPQKLSSASVPSLWRLSARMNETFSSRLYQCGSLILEVPAHAAILGCTTDCHRSFWPSSRTNWIEVTMGFSTAGRSSTPNSGWGLYIDRQTSDGISLHMPG